MMQKGDLYIKMFNTLSGVRFLFSHLLQFNILCTRQAQSYYTQNSDTPFARHSYFACTLICRYRRSSATTYMLKHSVRYQQ